VQGTKGINCQLAQSKGLCKRADCCGCVQMPATLYEGNWRLAQKRVKELLTVGDDVIPFTDDGFCVFLTKELGCVIYENRPEVCKLYGHTEELQCPYCKTNGNLRSPAKQRQVQRQINHWVDNQMDKMRRKVNGKRT
jgi:Fe-S-cluster containining protein